MTPAAAARARVTAVRSSVHRVAAAFGAIVLAALCVVAASGATTGAVSAAATPTATTIAVSLLSTSPAVPATTQALRPLRFTLQLTNTTDRTIDGIRILAFRGDPISSQSALDTSLASTAAAVPGDIEIRARRRTVVASLGPGATTTATFATTTGLPNGPGLCLCGNDVYPVYLGAYSSDESIAYGSTQTWVSSIYGSVRRAAVSWVWPLIDRPHRLLSPTQFTDDGLISSISGGRLDRALQTVADVEQRDPTLPITLAVDPDLLDELEVMAGGRYTVRSVPSAQARAVVAAGAVDARQWLARLDAVLGGDPALSLVLTPYADPDITSLARAGLTYTSVLPSELRSSVDRALGTTVPQSGIAWPAAGAVSGATLGELAGSGVRTVVLDSTSVTPSVVGGSPASLARIATPHGIVTGLLTSPAVEQYAASALTSTPTRASTLPQLLAEIAVRVDAAPSSAHTVLVTAPRYVDPVDPSLAAAAVVATSGNTFARAIALSQSLQVAGQPARRSKVRHVTTAEADLAPAIVADVTAARSLVPAARSLLARDPTAAPLLAELPLAVQRAESSAWRPQGRSIGGGTVAGTAYAHGLTTRLRALMNSVHIVAPSTSAGSYTLASSNSPLPITVANSSAYTVVVRLQVETVGNVPGLVARTMPSEVLGPDSKQTLHVPTEVQRPGQIQVRAILSTTSGQQLGRPVRLDVHSTVFGIVGIIITLVAGGVLLVALVVRYIRRIRRLRRKSSRTRPVPDPGRVVSSAGSAPRAARP